MSVATRCLILSAMVFLGGCTSIYQVRGIEPELDEPIVLNKVEDRDLENRGDLRRALEARSVENLRVCTSSKSYENWKSKMLAEPTRARSACPGAESFKLGVLEIDRDGSVNTTQKQQVWAMLDEEAEKARGKANLVIVVFIHGWHHGASVCDTNLACFRRLVGGLANSYRPGSRFVGLYLAWRGESVDDKTFNVFSIFHQKNRAEDIGRSGGINLLLELDSRYRHLKKLAQNPEGDLPVSTDVVMITAGHSLGGGMLLSALQTKLVGKVGDTEYIRSSDPVSEPASDFRPVVSGFGDLSVLLNPAIEAASFEPFYDDLKTWTTKYASRQTPVLLVLTSTADSADRRAFPISRSILPWGWFRKSASRQALGHYSRYRTHELRATKSVKHAFDASSCGCPQWVVGRALTEREQRAATAKKGAFGARLARSLPVSNFHLDPVFELDWDDNAPFWVVRSDASVIAGHNDIYSENVVRFLVLFLNAFLGVKGL
jgi:hypothetical protein